MTLVPALKLSNSRGDFRIEVDQIIRLQATSNYTRVYVANYPPFIASKVLKLYEAVLGPYGFVRTHKSHLINKSYIQTVENEAVTMLDASRAMISRRRKTKVIKMLTGRKSL